MSFIEKQHFGNLSSGSVEALRFASERRRLLDLSARTLSKLNGVNEAVLSGLLTREGADQLKKRLRRCYRWNRRVIKAGKPDPEPQQVDWHGKMTAKSAWKLGYISREQFVAIRKAFKAKYPNGGELQ